MYSTLYCTVRSTLVRVCLFTVTGSTLSITCIVSPNLPSSIALSRAESGGKEFFRGKKVRALVDGGRQQLDRVSRFAILSSHDRRSSPHDQVLVFYAGPTAFLTLSHMTSQSGLQLNLDTSALEVSGAGAVVSNQEQKPMMDNKVNDSQVGNASGSNNNNQGGKDDERSSNNVNDTGGNPNANANQVQYGEHSIPYATMHFTSQHPVTANTSGQVQGNPLFNGAHQHGRVLTANDQEGNAAATAAVVYAAHQPPQNMTAQTVIQSQFSSTPPASSLAETAETRFSYFPQQTDRVSPNAAAGKLFSS